MQLHFEHALPGRCGHQTVPFEKCHLTSLLRRGSPLQPLVEPEQQGGVIRCYTLNDLHDHLDPHGIEVRIQILNQSDARSSGIRCLRSSNCGISTGPVAGRIPVWGHHEDEAVILYGVPAGAGPDLGVIVR
jgi:hypothetical protein